MNRDRKSNIMEETEMNDMADNLDKYIKMQQAASAAVNGRDPFAPQNPQYQNSKAIDDDQAELARACEIWMGSEFQRFFETAE